MPIKSMLVLPLLLLAGAAPSSAAELYMSAGKTVYRFDGLGTKIGSAAVDASNFAAQGLDIGPDGRLYTAINAGSHRVDSFSLDLSSHITGFVGNGQAGLFIPIGISFGPDDNLYVADNNPNRIERFFGPLAGTPGGDDPLGANPGARWATVTSPVDVEFTPDGTLYATAATGTNGTIYRFDSTTGVATAVATDLQAGASIDGLAINASGTALFARDTGRVFKYTINPDHSLTRDLGYSVSYSAGGAGILGSAFPGLAFGPDGFLYATTRTLNGGPLSDADFVVRIDPNTGLATTFVHGNVNTFTDTQNPTFLVWVPEPGTLASATLGLIGFLACAWRLRRR